MNLTKQFQNGRWPDISTGFYFVEQPEHDATTVRVFHQSVEDFDTDFDTYTIPQSQEEFLQNYPDHIILSPDKSKSDWLIAPGAIDFFNVFPDDTKVRPDVCLNFNAFKSEYDIALQELPDLNPEKFIEISLIAMQPIQGEYMDGTYIFNKSYISNLLQDREWASQYAITYPGYLDHLESLLKNHTPQ